MKKILLFFILLLTISCKEEPKQTLKNQEVEITFVGYRNTEKTTHNSKEFFNREYFVEVEWQGYYYNIADNYFVPEEMDFEVGQKRIAFVYLYKNGKIEIKLK